MEQVQPSIESMKIDPKELRIGNILQSRDKDGDGSIIIVKEFDLVGVNQFVSQAGYEHEYLYEKTDYYDWYWVEPIPLTPDWLTKLGFEQEKSNDTEERDIWSIQVANNTSLYYDPELPGKEWYLSLEWNNNHWQNEFWATPKSVHQVQNLYYALTSEELTIKSFNQRQLI